MMTETVAERRAADESGRKPGRRRAAASFVVPPIAWVASLGVSYLVQDFACTAASSIDADSPAQTVLIVITFLNAVLLAGTVAVGIGALMLLRNKTGGRDRTTRFLAYTGAVSAAVFAYGIAMIAVHPFVLEVCP